MALAHRLGDPGVFVASALVTAAGLALAWPLRARPARPPSPLPAPARRLLVHRGVFVLGVWMLLIMLPYGVNVALLAVHASRRALGNPGVVFTAMALGLLVGLLAATRLASGRDLRRLIVWGLAAGATGMWAAAAFHGWWLVLAGGCSGLGFGLAQPLIYALAADRVPAAERGAAMATMGMFLEVGIAAGAIGGGLVAGAAGLPAMFLLAGLAPAAGAALVLGSWKGRGGR